MRDKKRRKLEAAGWRVGSADDFLKLSESESRQVTDSMPPPAAPRADGLRIPNGWTLESLPLLSNHHVLTTTSPGRYMATIDFGARGIRAGHSTTTTSRFVGEERNKRRKKYGGRGWKQALVDDAVAHLQAVLR